MADDPTVEAFMISVALRVHMSALLLGWEEVFTNRILHARCVWEAAWEYVKTVGIPYVSNALLPVQRRREVPARKK